MSNASPQSLELTYTSVEDMPAHHRNAAQLVVLQYTPQEIAAACDLRLQTVNKMLGHPPFMAHVRALQGRIAIETSKQHSRLMQLFASSMDTIEAAIDRMKTDVPKAELGDVAMILDRSLSVTREIADRLPGRTFTKVSRTEARSLDVRVVDSVEDPARVRLRERMTEISATVTTPEAKPVEQLL